MSSKSLHQRSGGFTVLEMAIALAISGAALTVLLQLLSTSVVTAGRADRISEATMFARSKLAEVTAIEPIKLGISTGSGPNDLSWRTEVSPGLTDEGTAETDRRLLTVTVLVFSRGNGRTLPILELKSFAFAVTE